jgi:hypothetical protein
VSAPSADDEAHPHACGVDDNARPFTSTNTYTPSAWMMHQDPKPFSVPFPVWVTSAKRYWVSLAKRRSDFDVATEFPHSG